MGNKTAPAKKNEVPSVSALTVFQRIDRGHRAQEVLKWLTEFSENLRDDFWNSLQQASFGESKSVFEAFSSTMNGYNDLRNRLTRVIHDGQIAEREVDKAERMAK